MASRIVYANRWMTVREDDIRRQDGSNGIFGVVEKSDFALIIPRADDYFVLVEQYRYPVDGRFWEFPQGSWEEQPDMPPEALARAELEEETGYVAGKMEHIGHLFEAYGYSNQGFNVYLASQLTEGTRRLAVEEQGMKVGRFSQGEVEDMIRTGAMKDAPSIAAYGLMRLC